MLDYLLIFPLHPNRFALIGRQIYIHIEIVCTTDLQDVMENERPPCSGRKSTLTYLLLSPFDPFYGDLEIESSRKIDIRIMICSLNDL